MAANREQVTLLSPVGVTRVIPLKLADRAGDLNDKVVGLLDNVFGHVGWGDVDFFGALRKLLCENYKLSEVVEEKHLHGMPQASLLDKLGQECDAVIVGIAA